MISSPRRVPQSPIIQIYDVEGPSGLFFRWDFKRTQIKGYFLDHRDRLFVVSPTDGYTDVKLGDLLLSRHKRRMERKEKEDNERKQRVEQGIATKEEKKEELEESKKTLEEKKKEQEFELMSVMTRPYYEILYLYPAYAKDPHLNDRLSYLTDHAYGRIQINDIKQIDLQ